MADRKRGPDILFVDDEAPLRLAAADTFELADLEAACFETAAEVLASVSRTFGGIVVSDIRMPGMDGLELMRRILEIDPELPVVLVTGHGDVQLAVDAMRAGAYDFIEKPFAPDHLTEVVRRAIDKRRLTLENRSLRSDITSRDDLETRLTGRTTVMIELRKTLRALAPADVDVLIIGETGVGKDVAARALHALSPRSEKPFVSLNCGALPADQIESELFGHEIGAFPGALRARYGKFEHARGGTVFLDEIESMRPDLQIKLLQVCEERRITRLGSNETLELDVRFIAASKVDLEAEVEAGRFRRDLLHRLARVSVTIPPLSERQEDVPRLFIQLANQAARRYRRDFPDVPAWILTEIGSRHWPGNVRELRNVADQYVLGLETIVGGDGAAGDRSGTLVERVARFESSAIAAELVAQKGVLKETYRALGLSRKSLYEKMQKYGLDRQDYVADADDR
ncbi:MAG: sigma-54 dependent transcriptional regulator [Pseudomonadota bacterium]